MTEADVACEAAAAACQILQAHTDGPRSITHKGSVDLVTEIDLACEEAIRKVLQHHTPDIPILGEEQGGPVDAPTRWVVDPLDGTTNFVHGYPFYCTSIALEVDEQPIAAAIGEPIRNCTWWAQAGHGAFCDDRPIRVSTRRTLDTALIGTGFAYDRREQADAYLGPFKLAMQRAQGLRRGGAAALELAMLADGHLDAFWEFNLKRWDVAAGVLLIREAGGRVSDHGGQPMTGLVVHPVASNGWLHEPMMALLEEAHQ
jgi:myo-inositol-1(or 4)-monophosphatase